MKWFRWYHGTCSNGKLGSIARKAGTTRERVIAVWALVLESASASDERGRFTLDADGIGDLLNCDTESVQRVLDGMADRKMIRGARVKNWEEYQSPHDSSTDRVRKHRAKKKGGDVTAVTVTVTPPEKEEDREVEGETDTTSSVLYLLAGEAQDVEGQVNEVVRVANRGMIDNPAIGSLTNPIHTAHGSREAVKEWLDLAPLEVVKRAVYGCAKSYKPDGRRRQITTMAYFTGAVADAADRWKASQTRVSDDRHGADDRGSTAQARGAAAPAPDRFAALTVRRESA